MGYVRTTLAWHFGAGGLLQAAAQARSAPAKAKVARSLTARSGGDALSTVARSAAGMLRSMGEEVWSGSARSKGRCAMSGMGVSTKPPSGVLVLAAQPASGPNWKKERKRRKDAAAG